MSRRDEWQRVLDAEVCRWSAMPVEQLLVELRELRVYEVELNTQTYQVEAEILQNKDDYVQVMVAVDDGSLPASLAPVTEVFICPKPLRRA